MRSLFKLILFYISLFIVPLSFLGAMGCKPSGEEGVGIVGIEGPQQAPAPESTQGAPPTGGGAATPTAPTFSPSCLSANVDAFKTSANNRRTQSWTTNYFYQQPWTQKINGVCPGAPVTRDVNGLPLDAVITATATFIGETSPQQTLTEVSITGITDGIQMSIVTPAGVITKEKFPGSTRIPPITQDFAWAFHYYAELVIQGQTIALGRLAQDGANYWRYSVKPNFTASLKGAVLNIKAVAHEAVTDNVGFNFTLPTTFSSVQDGSGGNQVESYTIFSGIFP